MAHRYEPPSIDQQLLVITIILLIVGVSVLCVRDSIHTKQIIELQYKTEATKEVVKYLQRMEQLHHGTP